MGRVQSFVFYTFLLWFVIFVISLCADGSPVTNGLIMGHFIFSVIVSVIIVSLVIYWDSKPVNPEDLKTECPVCGNMVIFPNRTCDNCGHNFNKRIISGYRSLMGLEGRLMGFSLDDLNFILKDLGYNEVTDKHEAVKRLSKISTYHFVEDYVNGLKEIKKEPRELCEKAVKYKKEREKENSFDYGKAVNKINKSRISGSYTHNSNNFLSTGEILICPFCGSVQPSYEVVCSVCGADLLSDF